MSRARLFDSPLDLPRWELIEKLPRVVSGSEDSWRCLVAFVAEVAGQTGKSHFICPICPRRRVPSRHNGRTTDRLRK